MITEITGSQPSIIVQIPEFVLQADRAISSSYAETAAFALSSLGSIESASYSEFAATSRWAGISDIPTGLVSSSAQATTWNVASSSVATSASFAISASWAPSVEESTLWSSIVGVPTGLVSSSAQATTWSVASASVATNAISASYFLVSSSRFVPVSSGVTGVGTIFFSSTRDALAYHNSSNEQIDIGYSTLIRTFNSTGVTIPRGTVVEYDGVHSSGRIRIKPAIARSSSQPQPVVLGVTHESTPNGAFGDVLSVGVLYDTNTGAFTEGNQLYLSTTTSGSLTESLPSIQFHQIYVATCVITQPSTGRLFVNTNAETPHKWENFLNVPVGLVSSSVQVSYPSLSNIPVGLVSSSAQITPLLPVGTVSSSAQVSYTGLSNTPVGIISSSAQLNALPHSASVAVSSSIAATASSVDYNNVINRPTLVSSSAQVNYAGLSNIPSGLVSSSAQATTWTVATASVATSASFAVSASWAPNVGGGSGLFASSSISASWASQSLSSSFAQTAVSASWAPGVGGGTTWSAISGIPAGLVSSSAQLPTGIISSSVQVNYTGIANIPVGIISSSVQLVPLLPVGTVSSSAQVSYTGLSNTPVGIISSSAQLNALPHSASVATSASIAATASFIDYANVANLPTLVSSSAQVNYAGLSNIPSGIVSSSVQVIPLLPIGVVSASAQVSFTGLSNIPVGLVSSSTQATSWAVASSSIATSASWAAVAVSASWAPGVGGGTTWSAISGIPAGLVSSSAQVSYAGLSGIPSGILSSSVQFNALTNTSASFALQAGNAQTAVSASWAPGVGGGTTWSAISGIPTGLVSSSAQLPVGIVSSSTQIVPLLPIGTVSSSAQVSFTGLSNIPVGIVSSSVQVSYPQLSNIPAGIISSSAQVNTILDADNVVSSSAQIQFSGISGRPSGLVSSSAQIAYADITGVPSGIVSSSAQASSWTVASSSVATSASYATVAQNVLGSITSASYALTASYALNGGGGGSPFDLGVARTGSIAGNNISVLNFTGAGIGGITVTGATASVNISAGTVDSASFATTASFAVSASWAPSTGGGNPIAVQDEGTEIVASPIAINFTGAGVLVTATGATASVSIPGGAGINAVRIVSASTNITTADRYVVVSSGFVTMSLPSADGIAGTEFSIQNSGDGQIFLSPNSANTINGYPFFVMQNKNSGLNLTSIGQTGWIVT